MGVSVTVIWILIWWWARVGFQQYPDYIHSNFITFTPIVVVAAILLGKAFSVELLGQRVFVAALGSLLLSISAGICASMNGNNVEDSFLSILVNMGVVGVPAFLILLFVFTLLQKMMRLEKTEHYD